MATATLLTQIKRHEGKRLFLYRDTVDKWTIGYGRNLSDNGITDAEALMMLQHDVGVAEIELDRALPWVRNLDWVRYNVLVEMSFNIGISRLLRFKKTLANLKARQYDATATEMLDSRWARQVGGRAVTLSKQMRSGNWLV